MQVSTRGKLGLVVLAILLAGGAWWWTSRPAAPPSSPASSSASASTPPAGGPPGAGGRRGGGGPQAVSVAAVKRQDLHVSVSAIGTITASNTAIVRAQVSGVLQKIFFEEGQPVKAGQKLAQIDPRTFEAALAQAEGALARDSAQLAGARLDLARYKDLWSKDAIARQQLESQEALVGQLEGTVKADEGTVANARVQLAYASVKAPISGRAGLRQADLGNVVQPSDANGIVSIAQTRPVSLVFAIPAANIGKITQRLRDGVAIPVTAWERGSQRVLASGQVASVDNAIDPATDTIKIKAQFPNKDDALFPNQSVGATVQLDTIANALAVPAAAVLRGSGGFYVYLVKEDKSVTARPVKTGAVENGWMAIEAELQPGDKVVVDGMDRLREGAKVEVIEPSARPGGGGPEGGKRKRERGAGSASASTSASASASAAK